MELLAPAGNMKSLIQAVNNGADAVYLGVSNFNARNNIDNFTLENLPDAVTFAHLNGVKVYLTLNILFRDDELQDALDVVFHANNAGVDAFIIQDLGLVKLIKENYKDVVIHASTQMAIHNIEGAKVAKELGFSRVVLSREVPLEEIRKIHDEVDIELEYFCQGALCVSFSGNCYLCSYANGNSGNRGKCQQFCRLPFSLSKNGKLINQGNLLSTKDICMLKRLKEMEDVGVFTLKIEGRARRPYYVAESVRVYRKVLDNEYKVSSEDVKALSLAFNRGDFCEGYYNGNDKIISNIQGHKGVNIGKVVTFRSGKNFNQIVMELNHELHQGDGLKFFREDKEVASIGAFDIKKEGRNFVVTTKAFVQKNDKVNLTVDAKKEEELNFEKKKVGVDFIFVATENEPICLTAICNDVSVSEYGEVAITAVNQPVDYNTCYESLSKLKDSNFKLNKLEVLTNNAFVKKSSLNEVRRIVIKKLEEELIRKYNNQNKIVTLTEIAKIEKNAKKMQENSKKDEKIVTFSDFKEIKHDESFDKIIYDVYDFSKNNLEKFASISGEKYLMLPNYADSYDLKKLRDVIKDYNFNIVCNNLYALKFEGEKIAGSFLNVYNSFAIELLKEFGINTFFIAELNNQEFFELQKNNPDCTLLRYKKVYMTLRHCPLKNNGVCNCSSCNYEDGFVYQMDNGIKLKLKRKKLHGCTFYLE